MRLFLHQNRCEAALQQMAHPRMPPIEALRIPAVQLAHPERQIRLRCFKEEMIVVVHQAVGMAEPAVAIHDVGKHGEKLRSVAVVHHDVLSGVPPTGDVVGGSGVLYAKWAGHTAGLQRTECGITRPNHLTPLRLTSFTPSMNWGNSSKWVHCA